MDKLRVLRIFVKISRLPVGETAPHGDNQIRRRDGVVRRFRAVHAREAQKLWMRIRQRADAHQGFRHREPVFLDEFLEFLRRVGGNDAAARDDHRTLRVQHHVLRLRRANQEVRVRLTVYFLFGRLRRRTGIPSARSHRPHPTCIRW